MAKSKALVALVADIHNGPVAVHRGVPQKLGPYAVELLAGFVGEMNGEAHPDVVVQLGDAIEDADILADSVNYHAVMETLDCLDAPHYNVIGNHDRAHIPEGELLGLAGLERTYYSFTHGPYRFIVLDTALDAAYRPTVSAEQLSWLEEELSSSDADTVVLSHACLADQDLSGNVWFSGWEEGALVSNRAAVREALRLGNVRAAFCGHVHWDRMDVQDGIPYFSLQSLVENARGDGVPSGAYALVSIDEDTISVSVMGIDPVEFSYP